MNFYPQKAEYIFEVMNHSMRTVAIHEKAERIVRFYFDEKLVSTRNIPNGDLLSDDDYIRKLVEEYSKKANGVYADLFMNHSDKVNLISKAIEVRIEDFNVEINARVVVLQNKYDIELSSSNGDDSFSGSFKSDNFPEVLEKLRFFINILGDVSSSLANHINEISNDKIEEVIRWK